ncbi:MAG TPA: Nramp family divalent metal transporter [Propionibacteriaceae bacterium]|nr:Nramp family divalent metal transporter [Propionibacteriaceae bacterium]
MSEAERADPSSGRIVKPLGVPPVVDPAEPSPERKDGRVKRFFRMLGPGLVTGVADDDPSGIATYSQAGAGLGMGLLWTGPFALVLMYAVQEICDRTALVTGDSLGALVRRRFPRGARYFVALLVVSLIVANGINIAADLAAIGAGMQLLHLGPPHLWAAVAGVLLTAAVVWGSFEKLAKLFKWLCLVLLTYVGVLAVAHVPWGEVGAGFLGLRMHWSWNEVALIVAVLGTTISPYMFFWESAQRVEELRATAGGRDPYVPWARRPIGRRDLHQLRKVRADVFTGMLISTLGMLAIIISTASTIGRNGPVEIHTAAEAAKALEPIAGPAASIVFALGFVATGVLAVPVLAGSGAAAMSGLLGKPWGFDKTLRRAPLFYVLIAAGTLGGVIIAWVSKDPVGLLVFSAIINGIAAAPFLVVVMLISNSRTLLGEHRNGVLANVLGWITTAVMAVAGVVGVYVTLFPPQ